MRGNAPRGRRVEPVTMTANNPLSLWYRNQDSTLRHRRGRGHLRCGDQRSAAVLHIQLCKGPLSRTR